ncbi:hypothetical protein QJS04_geneDACA013199 [Acorus gramineus]|uniref:UFSP1/2/DUB catalytic domain-containing protein n=1 Tax=Acorus gramineus TaxID=55184 RepID=A0AAV9BBX8_ACOGR|nr:hypothetical protein QJS04_geneDACA013199 [Acorus gramineus]
MTHMQSVIDIMISEVFAGAGGSPKASTSRFSSNCGDHAENRVQEKFSRLVRLQIRSPLYKVQGGLMDLLKRCLDLESGSGQSIISGHVDHFQSIESEDSGWGCGWRNIQMLSSHLLAQRQEARQVMFGGSGFVPDIPSLQRWLEIAWEMGFDIFGSDTFNRKICGSTEWIGTTECATLFRSFGLRARIVDFGSEVVESLSSSVNDANAGSETRQMRGKWCRGKRKSKQFRGPMDKFLLGRTSDTSQVDSILEGSSSQGAHDSNDIHKANFLLEGNAERSIYSTEKIKGQQVLVDWVWNYFTDKNSKRATCSERVTVSEKMPLYFQHAGHSRTIVGVQVQKGLHGIPEHRVLLILDPGHRTEALERSLKENIGWQKLIKRGVHALKKPQYQLCYVDPGIACGEELEQLKTIHSIFIKF